MNRPVPSSFSMHLTFSESFISKDSRSSLIPIGFCALLGIFSRHHIMKIDIKMSLLYNPFPSKPFLDYRTDARD